MKNINKTAFIIGTSIAAVASINTATANNNPFAMSDLSSGYMNVAEADSMGKMKEGNCGANKAKAMMEKKAEGKCGEGKCGENKAKAMTDKKMEGSCGAKKADKITEGACGANKAMDKMPEGKCGEGKGKEGSCGVMNMMSNWF